MLIENQQPSVRVRRAPLESAWSTVDIHNGRLMDAAADQTPMELEPSEVTLRQNIEKRLAEARALLADHWERNIDTARADYLKKIEEIAGFAHDLHTSLLHRDLEPKHHSYMLQNRGCSPLQREFYADLHPVEDLLKYLDDPNANDDPEDTTIGEKFEFSVFSRRWRHKVTYTLTRTATGWDVSSDVLGGPCDRRGEPFLYKNLQRDGIAYPSVLPACMKDLWHAALPSEGGWGKDKLQNRLNELAEWVSVTDRATPPYLRNSHAHIDKGRPE